MFEKNLKLSYLLDFYGSVLDEQTLSVMKAYYNDDLSLAEIAAGMGISRQGVHHTVKKGEEQLLFLESRLALAETSRDYSRIKQKLEDALCALSDSPSEKIAIDNIKEAIDIISRKLS